MLQFLSKLFIKNHEDIHSPAVRKAYGYLCGYVGIFFNICLFIGKFLAGSVSGSIAIVADAFNNLSDAASSIITLLGFHMAGQKPDSKHPYGHGRYEYISGLLVSILIILMAFELLKSSFQKILHPQDLQFSLFILVFLVLSILVKGYMAYYNHKIGKKIASPAMKATAIDSLSDMIATSVVLLSTLLSYCLGLQIDGWCGGLVGLFILYAGVRSAIETISPLLGQAPDPDFVEKVLELVLKQDGILGVHDLIVHNYGPDKSQISLHAEVSDREDLVTIHDKIDLVEHLLKSELGCDAVIHMDPVAENNEEIHKIKEGLQMIFKDISPQISMHDLHIVSCSENTQLHFDLVVPYNFKLSDDDLIELVQEKLRLQNASFGSYETVIQVDHSTT